MYSTTLKKRFCKDTNIPINLFQEPYFSERLKLYDNVFNSLRIDNNAETNQNNPYNSSNPSYTDELLNMINNDTNTGA